MSARRLEALEEGERARARADLAATRIIARAEAEAESIREVAAQEGRSECAKLLIELKEHARLEARAAKDRIVDLALTVAQKLLHDQLTLSPHLIERVVARTLREAEQASRITVRVHPDDAPLVESSMQERPREDPPVRVMPDETIARGGCLLDSDLGQVDGRIEVQLSVIRAALRGDHEG